LSHDYLSENRIVSDASPEKPVINNTVFDYSPEYLSKSSDIGMMRATPLLVPELRERLIL
jgi:hypothetical protein